jgi:hypothetical protein
MPDEMIKSFSYGSRVSTFPLTRPQYPSSLQDGDRQDHSLVGYYLGLGVAALPSCCIYPTGAGSLTGPDFRHRPS